MKVAKLIELLQQMDPEQDVHFAYNYGDHWRTQVAPPVTSADEQYVKYSEYHRMPRVVESEGDEDGAKLVLVLVAGL